jgi:hypothetical protein
VVIIFIICNLRSTVISQTYKSKHLRCTLYSNSICVFIKFFIIWQEFLSGYVFKEVKFGYELMKTVL